MEGQRPFAGGRQGQVGLRFVRRFERGDRAFGVAEGGVDLVQAVAALGVVADAPGVPPEDEPEAGHVELLGEVPQVQGEAVFAAGFAHMRGERDRLAVGSEAEAGGKAGRCGEVEDAEGPGFAAGVGALQGDDPDLGDRRAALSREARFERRDTRGVEKSAALHFGTAVGFSISPGGRSSVRSLRSPSEYSPAWLKLTSVTSE